MKVNLISYTKIPDYNGPFNMNLALEYCAKMAGICYMDGSFDNILKEDSEQTKKRLNQVLNSGHHSVFDHFTFVFEFKDISKIIAMIFNNENDYATSEKSARYTKFKELPEPEKTLYFKWYGKLQPIIKEKYPTLYNEKLKNPMMNIEKLAQENARYFVSIFTRSTSMGHKISLRQLNYLIYMCKQFILNEEETEFNIKVKRELKEFISLFNDYIVENLIPKGKNRKLSLFGNERFKNIPDILSYQYQVKIKASYACLAQMHRHRSEDYFMFNTDNFEFYIPEILETEELKKEWLDDAILVKDLYPQGRLIDVVNTGNIDTLLLKATERICGCAQLEVMRHTTDLIEQYCKKSEFKDYILEFTNDKKAKCLFKNGVCGRPCMLATKQYERII